MNTIEEQLQSRGFKAFVIIAVLAAVLNYGLPYLARITPDSWWVEPTTQQNYVVDSAGKIVPLTPLEGYAPTFEAQNCEECHKDNKLRGEKR